MDMYVILVVLTLMSTQADPCSEDQQCSNCSSTTEYCNTECFPGFFGLKCSLPCGKNCKERKCSRTKIGTYRCYDGCMPGYRGSQCNIPCKSPRENCTKCPDGCDGIFCHLTSYCVTGCHDQYYGANCKSCSPRCRHCNRITGRCDVCRDPYHGLDCEYSCEHCSTTDCVHTCAPGLYGRTCSERCSKNCLAYPPSNNTLTRNSSKTCISECQRYSGECINGCVDGWSGPNCSPQVQCNSNCLGCNETGACVEGCSPGYYGEDCKPCPRTCFNNTCHPESGVCVSGCIRGQYGQSCQLSCSHCPGAACHATTGLCDEGTTWSTMTVVSTGLFTSCILLIVGVIAGVFLFRRCRKGSSTERDNQGDELTHAGTSRPVETSEYYAIHRYWEIKDYDEVSHPQVHQQGRAGAENDDEVSQQHEQHQGPAEKKDYNEVCQLEGRHQIPAGEEDYDEVSQARGFEQRPNLADPCSGPLVANIKRDQALPFLTDILPEALNAEDHPSETSSSSASSSHSYTSLGTDIFIDDPGTVVRYISPTEDKT